MIPYIRWLIAILGVMTANAALADDRACCRDENNWYAGGSLMAVLPNQVSLDESRTVFGKIGYDLNTSPGFSGLVGYQIFRNASIELEVLSQSRDIGSLTNIDPLSDTNGGINNIGVMLNHRWIYRDMGLIAPYIGVGAGIMHTNGFIEVITVGPDEERQEFDDTVFAYQLMLGANFEIPDSQFELFAGYRYVGASEATTKFGILANYAQKYDNISSHSIDFGGRMHF